MSSKLITLVGLAGSGKSTYAKTLSDRYGYKIHSSDALRKEMFGDENVNSKEENERMFAELHRRIKDDLKNGTDVIYDATNINKRNRIDFLRYIDDVKCDKLCVLVMLPFQMCLERNANRERKVPDKAIKRMYTHFQPPHPNEGWDDFQIFINCEKSEIVPYSERVLFNMASGIDWFSQDSHKYEDSLGTHSRKTAKIMAEYKNELEYTALIHDVGKVFTKSRLNSDGKDDGYSHYPHHNNVGAYDSIFYLINDDECDADGIIYRSNLIYYHMSPYYRGWNDTKSKEKRLISQLGKEMYDDILLLHKCDVESHKE